MDNNCTCFPDLIIVRPELVRLYWLGGDAICDFNLSAANGETFPVGKAPWDPSSMRELGFAENEDFGVGVAVKTDGLGAETGSKDDGLLELLLCGNFIADGNFVDVLLDDDVVVVEAEFDDDEFLPFSEFWGVVLAAIRDEIFPAVNGEGDAVSAAGAGFEGESKLAGSTFPSSLSSTAWLSPLVATTLLVCLRFSCEALRCDE